VRMGNGKLRIENCQWRIGWCRAAISSFQFSIPQTPILVVASWLLLALSQTAQAQEDIIHRKNGIKDRGKILSQDSTGVRILLVDSRREMVIRNEDIERIEVKRTAQQEEGEELFERKEYKAAAAKFDAAMKFETRAWLRGRIASKLVACYVAAGDPVAAVESFFTASQATDGNYPLSAIPIWWLPEPPGGSVTQEANSLLRSSIPLHQVIGASFLFGTEQSSAARDTLAKLTTYPGDERIALLARTQLWRWDSATVKPQEIASWQRQLSKLPHDGRGGPYFAIGMAMRRLGQHDEAALAFLWPALVYRADPNLSARATLMAAESLEKAGQKTEAEQMYQEVIARFSPSSEATAAQRRLNSIKE